MIKNKLKQLLSGLKKFRKGQIILYLDYKKGNDVKSPIQVLN